MSTTYAALIIDLQKSRSYANQDRYYIQYHIMDVLNFLNKIFHPDILRDVDFSAGDEIQGLFRAPEIAYLYYRLFSMFLSPVGCRAGIGVGGWDIQIDSKGTTGQDGPAYHNARRAIDNTDEADGYPILFYSGSYSDITINTIIGGAASIMAKQSPHQSQIMLLTELLFPICNYSVDMYECVTSNEIIHLLQSKSRLDHEFARLYDRFFPFDRISADSIVQFSPTSTVEMNGDAAFFITSGRKRGIPTKLSSILNISRQTLEKTLKTGNVFTARNMSITALIEMTNAR